MHVEQETDLIPILVITDVPGKESYCWGYVISRLACPPR